MAYALAARLERAVKRAGVKYKKVSGWASRGHGAMGSIRGIVAHHTAGPKSGNSPSLNVVAYGRAGLSGPLAQLFLARDGTVYLVAAGVSYHAGRVNNSNFTNSHALGIEAENTGLSNDSPWPAHQVDAYAKLCKALCDEFGLPTSRVRGHKEVCSPRGRKIDPTLNMSQFRKKVGGAKGGVSQDGGSGGATYKDVNTTAPLGLYDKDPKNGHTRIADWQGDALGYTGKDKDGRFGPGTERDTKALQRQLGVEDDGLVGDDTMAAWIKAGRPKLGSGSKPKPKPKPAPKPKAPKFPLPAGHWYGVESRDPRNHSGYYERDRAGIRQLQQGLKDRGWKILVDGIYGENSRAIVTAFQKKAGLRVDGGAGAEVWNAVFKKPLMKK